MMTIWVAVIMSCTASVKDPRVSCTMGGSQDVYKSKEQCETDAPKTYRKPVRCIDVDVEIKENVNVRLK